MSGKKPQATRWLAPAWIDLLLSALALIALAVVAYHMHNGSISIM